MTQNDNNPKQTETEVTQVVVAECPMSWCSVQAVVENPETEYEAAKMIQEHVNEDHSEKDIDTLGRTGDEDGE